MKVNELHGKEIFVVDRWLDLGEQRYTVTGYIGVFSVLTHDEDGNVIGYDIQPKRSPIREQSHIITLKNKELLDQMRADFLLPLSAFREVMEPTKG